MVEIAVIMVATGVAARAVHWAAESLGLAEAARVRGEAAETAVLNAVTNTTHAHAPRDGGKASATAPSEAQSKADADADYDSLFDDLPHYAPDAAAEEHAREQRHEAPALLHAYLTRPATTLVWATGGAAALRSALRAAAVALNGGEPAMLLGVPALTLLGGAWRLTLIACVAWGSAVWTAEALERSAAQHPRHAAAYFAARALARRGIAVAAVLAALSVMRVPLQALVTFGGVSGVVFGIGARAAASNALAGFFMMLTHTLHEGDAVELVGRGISGVVVDVSLTATTILSQDATYAPLAMRFLHRRCCAMLTRRVLLLCRTVSLPNAELTKVPLRNFTRARVAAFIAAYPLPLHRLADAPAAIAAMERFMAQHPAVARTAAGGRLRSAVSLLGPGPAHDAAAVTLQARAYIDARGRSSADIERVRQELLVGLGGVIAAASGSVLEAPAMRMQLVRARRMRLRRRERAPQETHEGEPPHKVQDFSWRGGEIEAEGNDTRL